MGKVTKNDTARVPPADVTSAHISVAECAFLNFLALSLERSLHCAYVSGETATG